MKSILILKRDSSLILFLLTEVLLWLMSRTDIQHAPIEENRQGLTHFAFSFDSKEEVLQTTELLRTKGYIIASEPRTSGDGYFESVILDPDGNRIECVYK